MWSEKCFKYRSWRLEEHTQMAFKWHFLIAEKKKHTHKEQHFKAPLRLSVSLTRTHWQTGTAITDVLPLRWHWQLIKLWTWGWNDAPCNQPSMQRWWIRMHYGRQRKTLSQLLTYPADKSSIINILIRNDLVLISVQQHIAWCISCACVNIQPKNIFWWTKDTVLQIALNDLFLIHAQWQQKPPWPELWKQFEVHCLAHGYSIRGGWG